MLKFVSGQVCLLLFILLFQFHKVKCCWQCNVNVPVKVKCLAHRAELLFQAHLHDAAKRSYPKLMFGSECDKANQSYCLCVCNQGFMQKIWTVWRYPSNWFLPWHPSRYFQDCHMWKSGLLVRQCSSANGIGPLIMDESPDPCLLGLWHHVWSQIIINTWDI